MIEPSAITDVDVSLDGHVAIVEMRRPPHNHFDTALMRRLADAFEALDADARCRSIVLCSSGSAFCAGADFSKNTATSEQGAAGAIHPVYEEAIRLFSCTKPVVAAIHGPAIGGGLGLALVADFRVGCPEARFSANFNRLGLHPGFGLSFTLPRLIGNQHASLLFFTGRRIGADEAASIGLIDVLTSAAELRSTAMELAREIATSAPLAVVSTRKTLRKGVVDQIRAAVAHESHEQNWQTSTEDFKEGVAAMAKRRTPSFTGK